MLKYLFTALLLLSCPLAAQDIKFPNPPAPQVKPQPIVTGQEPLDLYQNQTLVIESDNPFFLLMSEESDSLSITEDTGPRRVRGIFAPAPQNAVPVSKEYTSKYLAFVEVLTPPSDTKIVKLIAVPTTIKAKNEIKIQAIRVVGSDPTPNPPPPIPGPGPGPTPQPPPQPVGDLRVILIYESSANNSTAHIGVLNSVKIYDFLNSNAKEWRKWDKDVILTPTESKEMQQIWANLKPKVTNLPAIAVIRGTTGQIYPLPDTVDATIALIKQ